MNELTEQGVAIIMVSSELPEVLGISDRIMVIHEGNVSKIFNRGEATQEKIMQAATGRDRMKNMVVNNFAKLGPLIGLLLIMIILGFVSDNFFTLDNLLNLLRQISINALIAFGMTFVILTGGIDLSVGSILAFRSALTAGMLSSGMDPLLAVFIGLLAGFAMGAFNGLVITKGK